MEGVVGRGGPLPTHQIERWINAAVVFKKEFLATGNNHNLDIIPLSKIISKYTKRNSMNRIVCCRKSSDLFWSRFQFRFQVLDQNLVRYCKIKLTKKSKTFSNVIDQRDFTIFRNFKMFLLSEKIWYGNTLRLNENYS